MTLTPEVEQMIEEKVRRGDYHSANEVVREGLRLLEERDLLRQMRLERLRGDIRLGIQQSDANESEPLDIEALKAEGRRRLSERSGVR